MGVRFQDCDAVGVPSCEGWGLGVFCYLQALRAGFLWFSVFCGVGIIYLAGMVGFSAFPLWIL